jgi:Bacterial RNA polymerase, alpha chain C terminal domain
MRVTKLDLTTATLACLKAAGITDVERLVAHPCDELLKHPNIGPAELYEVIHQLNRLDLTLPANHFGRVRVPSARNLEMFRLRCVEGLPLAEVGRQTGVTGTRVHQLLRDHFGSSRRPTQADYPGLERLILLELLRHKRPKQRSRPELERALSDMDRNAIHDSLCSLAAVGAVNLDGRTVQASPAARRIEALDMICI